MGWGGVVRSQEVQAVWDLQAVRARARLVGPAVLPDDAPRLRVDDHHAIAVVVVGGDQAIRQALGEARVVEHAGTGLRMVGPEDLPLPVELVDAAWSGGVGDQVAVGTE